MKKYLIIIALVFILADTFGQQGNDTQTGQVSFVSSGNVYVKFRSTTGISAGDTLYTKTNGNLVPYLIVSNLSSMSCVCTPLAGTKPAVADAIVARVRNSGNKAEKAVAVEALPVVAVEDTLHTPVNGKQASDHPKQHINGSISAYSYSNFSNTVADNSQRFRYTLSLDARNIGDSKFSVESYVSFRHKLGDWQEVKSNIFNALKIYTLAVVYDPNKTTRISIGRRINPRLSNIGASDGLQVEKSFGKFSAGALAGTRPDYTDYGFNSSLLQFGGYLGLNTKNKNTWSETSVAFMQQMNGSNIDRRFIYFQHSNSIVKNLYFIGTFEADLYKLNVDTVNHTSTKSSTPELTGLYLSLRYRFSDKFSLSGSYDARKNVIYYETYKSYLDRMLENETRQGYRLQMNYRITRELTLGLQGGYRFIKSDPRPSKNVYGYLTYNSVPGINVSVTVSGTYMQSSYMNGQIYGATIMRDLFKGKMQTSVGYRYADYIMSEGNLSEIQHIGEANIYWLLPAKFSFGINYEGTFEQQNKFHMVYLQLRKRF